MDLKKKKKFIGRINTREELIINLLSIFFQIYFSLIYLFWINIRFLDSKKKKKKKNKKEEGNNVNNLIFMLQQKKLFVINVNNLIFISISSQLKFIVLNRNNFLSTFFFWLKFTVVEILFVG